MLFCFLDTNVIHEFKPITEINWVKEMGTSEVCLVVTSVVVQELDKHKSGNNSRLKKKSRKWTAFLENLDVGNDNEIRENVHLRLDLSEPKDGTFDEYNLSASVADDRLLAKALEFATRNKADKVAVVSDDSAVRLKARGHTLIVPTLSEDNRLEHEPDPVTKELNELRIENQRLQNTQPKLQIGFRDSNGKLVNCLHTSNDFSRSLISEAELDDLIEGKCENLQSMREDRPIANDRLSLFTGSALTAKIVTSSQIEEYNRKLEEYPGHLRKHLLDKSIANVFPHRSVELNLVLTNDGSIPAQNVEIRLDVEGSTKVLLQVPEAPLYEPSPPAKPEPRSLFDFDQYNRTVLPFLGHGIHGNNTDLGPPWEEWARETDSSGAAWFGYGIAKLSHHRSCEIEVIYLMFYKDNDFPKIVTIEYEVTADNMANMLAGHLTVVVSKEPSCNP